MSDSKLISLAEAIAEFVTHGSTVVMGTCLEAMIPFAAGHEMIWQKMGPDPGWTHLRYLL